jgi:BirA family transcriptional regulator, biotin operon repressor / biotin---[acetyl-CoA-carboxylase] ligase
LNDLDTHEIAGRLVTLESIALIQRVASTNALARRVVDECIQNEVSLPTAMIIAGEQTAGRGRNARRWSSPAGKGIYATTLIMRPAGELPMVPLETANIIVSYLRDVFAIDARIKWPNDILAGGRKIAGILIEARMHDDHAYLVIGTGINVEPVNSDDRPSSVAIAEVSKRDFGGIGNATKAFIEHVDARLSQHFDRERVLDEWRSLAIHRRGDRVTCDLGTRMVSGAWDGIDEHGRALLVANEGTIAISAGDLIL